MIKRIRYQYMMLSVKQYYILNCWYFGRNGDVRMRVYIYILYVYYIYYIYISLAPAR